MNIKPIIVGITGASGVVYGIRLLETLRNLGVETHLVMSKSAHLAIEQELELDLQTVRDKAGRYYPISDVGAAIASGSFRTMGMVIAPCTVKSMSEISCRTTGNLLTRAADVTLKERRKLVLMVRETPLHLGHLRSMTQLAEMGAIIMPPVPAFYMHPQTISDMVDHTVGRVLDLFDIEHDAKRWNGLYKPLKKLDTDSQ